MGNLGITQVTFLNSIISMQSKLLKPKKVKRTIKEYEDKQKRLKK